jgi:hypothetical protein
MAAKESSKLLRKSNNPSTKYRWDYLFRSAKGRALVAIAMISLVTAVWGMLSGPMVEFGINVWQWSGDIYAGQHYRYLRGGSKDN